MGMDLVLILVVGNKLVGSIMEVSVSLSIPLSWETVIEESMSPPTMSIVKSGVIVTSGGASKTIVPGGLSEV